MEYDANAIQILSVLVGIVLPSATQLLTRTSASALVKTVVGAFLASAIGLGSEIINAAHSNQAFDLKSGLITALGTALTAIAVHYGLLKPSGAASELSAKGLKDKQDTPLS